MPGSKLPLFPLIGDKLINPIVGVYIPIIRIPIKRWDEFFLVDDRKNITMQQVALGCRQEVNKHGYNPIPSLLLMAEIRLTTWDV